MSTPRLLLIRHGQSTWNAERRWQGRANPPLSAEGEEQAARAAARLAETDEITAITSSTLTRARRTAEIIAAANDVDLLAPHPDFVERDIGPWQGLTRDEIEERYPGWLADNRRPSEVEVDAVIVARATAAARELADVASEQRLAVVTHGGVIGVLERAGGARRQPIVNLSARWFALNSEGLMPDGDRVDLAEPQIRDRGGPSGSA